MNRRNLLKILTVLPFIKSFKQKDLIKNDTWWYKDNYPSVNNDWNCAENSLIASYKFHESIIVKNNEKIKVTYMTTVH